jgi:hypothetical protein
VHAGELTNLTVKVSGKGNLPIINVPSIKLPDGIESYDPKTEENLHPESVPLSGVKIFKFPISVSRQGNYIIDPIRFSYFDPVSKSYKSDSTQPLAINVMAALANHEKQTPLSALVPTVNEFPQKMLLAIVATLVLALLAILFVLYRRSENRKKKALEEMIAREKAKAAMKRDPLEKARMMIVNSDQISFLKEMENVIWKKTAETLAIPRALLNQPKVMEELRSRGAQDAADLFRDVVNRCETMLYIPGTQAENLHLILNQTEELFRKFDSL